MNMSLRLSRIILAVCLPLLMVAGLSGCSTPLFKPKMTKLSIPDLPTVKEQYIYAVRFRDNTFPAANPERRADQRNQFRQVFQRVVDLYPNDRQYSAMAKIHLTDFDRDDGKYRQALEKYRSLQSEYPEFTFLKARAMFSEAQVLDELKRFDEAKGIYRRIMTEFANEKNQGIPTIVKKSSDLYYLIRKDQPEGRKWSR